MSKNLTRKGLAFGALVALGSSVLAGAPAYAADSVVLAANYTTDKTLAAPVTETITLNASLAPGSTAANISQLKYKIVTDSSYVASVSTVSAGGSTSTAWGTTAATVYTNTSGTTGRTTGVFGASGTVKTTTYVTPNAPTALVSNTLTLGVQAVADTNGTTGVAPTTATATKTAVVTAFIDANLNGALDSGEVAQEQTITFRKFSEITTTTKIDAATEGDTTVVATVKYTNINNEALGTVANVGAFFTKGEGSTLKAADTAASVTAITQGTGTAVVYTATNTFAVGDTVTVAGATTAGYNGTFTVTAATSANFTVASSENSATVTVTSATATRTHWAASLQSGVAFSSTNDGFKYTTGTVTGLSKTSSVKVQPVLKATGALVSNFAAAAVGSSQTADVASRKLGEFSGNTVASTTAFAGTAAGTVTAPASGTAAANVALNAEKQVYFLAKDTTAVTKKAISGQAVAVKVTTSATLSSTVTLTVNGTVYTSNAALPGATGVAKLAISTNADGKAFVTYKTAGFSHSATVVVEGTSENSTATVTATEATRNFTGASLTGDQSTGNANSTYIASHEGDTAVTTDGAAVKVDVIVQDQFGGKPADSTYQVTASFSSSSQTTAATSASATFAPVVGGKATLTILDNGTGNGTNVYAIDLREVATNGVLSNSVKAIAATFTVKIAAAADVAAGEVLLAGTGASLDTTTGLYGIATGASNSGASDSAKALTYSDFANVDGRAIAVTAPANTDLTPASVTGLQFTGTVNSASTATYGGVAVPGASVTVSGAGMQFSVTQDGSAIYGDGTLTFVANATGQFTVNVWSHVAGKNSITVTSGTGKATYVVYFAAAAEAAASKVTVKVADGAAQFQSGRALDVVFTVTDKLGNPVNLGQATNAAKLTIAQTGAGYLSLSGDQATGDAGTFTSKLITNSGDLGTSTITATVDFSSTSVTDLVATNSSEFGITDVTDISSAGKAIYVNTEFAKGKVVTVYIDGKRMPVKAAEATDNAVERKYTQKKAGKHTVTVRVSGGIVASETVVTTK